MTNKDDGEKTGRQREAELKKKRRSEQLRRNLSLRKAQSRARRAGDADNRGDGLPTSGTNGPDEDA